MAEDPRRPCLRPVQRRVLSEAVVEVNTGVDPGRVEKGQVRGIRDTGLREVQAVVSGKLNVG